MVKVGEKGQVVIPAKARKIFHIKPGGGAEICDCHYDKKLN